MPVTLAFGAGDINNWVKSFSINPGDNSGVFVDLVDCTEEHFPET